ncbi:MAG: hypothetical protein JWN38_666 [Candidatus Saccharibacteria bacterium]|nr:hypothetical protein [Candidatus Saccharibacteria bacterium]
MSEQAPQPQPEQDLWAEAPMDVHQQLAEVYNSQDQVHELVGKITTVAHEGMANQTLTVDEARSHVDSAFDRRNTVDGQVAQVEAVADSVASGYVVNAKANLTPQERKGTRRATRPATNAEAAQPEAPTTPAPTAPATGRTYRRATRPAGNTAPKPTQTPNTPPTTPNTPTVPPVVTPPAVAKAPATPNTAPAPTSTAKHEKNPSVDYDVYRRPISGARNRYLEIEKRAIYGTLTGEGAGKSGEWATEVAEEILEHYLTDMVSFTETKQFQQELPGGRVRQYEKRMLHAQVLSEIESTLREAGKARGVEDVNGVGVNASMVKLFEDNFGNTRAAYINIGAGQIFIARQNNHYTTEKDPNDPRKSIKVLQQGVVYLPISQEQFYSPMGPSHQTDFNADDGFSRPLLKGDRLIMVGPQLHDGRRVSELYQGKAITSALEGARKLNKNTSEGFSNALAALNTGNKDQPVMIIEIDKAKAEAARNANNSPEKPVTAKTPRLHQRLGRRALAAITLENQVRDTRGDLPFPAWGTPPEVAGQSKAAETTPATPEAAKPKEPIAKPVEKPAPKPAEKKPEVKKPAPAKATRRERAIARFEAANKRVETARENKLGTKPIADKLRVQTNKFLRSRNEAASNRATKRYLAKQAKEEQKQTAATRRNEGLVSIDELIPPVVAPAPVAASDYERERQALGQ